MLQVLVQAQQVLLSGFKLLQSRVLQTAGDLRKLQFLLFNLLCR